MASTSEDTWFAYGAELLKITFDYHSTVLVIYLSLKDSKNSMLTNGKYILKYNVYED